MGVGSEYIACNRTAVCHIDAAGVGTRLWVSLIYSLGNLGVISQCSLNSGINYTKLDHPYIASLTHQRLGIEILSYYCIWPFKSILINGVVW